MFLVAVGFWNFIGAGIFGFLINLPIVSYYEIGTALTANHGHAAMMGVYGMLALGLAMFCLRYIIPAERWPERWAKVSLLVHGTSVSRGCASRPCSRLASSSSTSRSPPATSRPASSKFLTNDTNTLIEWLRLPGDIVFIAGGAIPALYIAYIGIRHTVKRVTLLEPEDILFTELTTPEGASRSHRRRGERGGG